MPDQATIASEIDEKLPGLLDPFEDGGDGTHTTDTVDYGICLEGELCLRLDNDAEVTLTPGTCVLQLGTRHAWQNRSDQPALMCYVQIRAPSAPGRTDARRVGNQRRLSGPHVGKVEGLLRRTDDASQSLVQR